ncbi:MAG: DNA polymerase III subunit delta [Pseudomonadota bacterium]
MTALRSADVGKRLSSVDKVPPVVLVFGPDRGHVSETAERIAKLFAGNDDPFGLIRLDGPALRDEPGRLVDEARTVSMFGGRRLVWLRDAAGQRALPDAVAPLLADPPNDAVVLIEAGDYKRGQGLRKDVEAASHAVAIHCPIDDARGLERMITEEAASFDLSVEPDAMMALQERLGADRGASRQQVRTACLHAVGNGALTLADVDAVVGDVSLVQMNEAVDAALLGDKARLARLLPKLLKQESHAVQLLQTANWTLQAFETGAATARSASDAVAAMRPPLYGPRKAAASKIFARWSAADLRRASAAVAAAVFATRTMPHLSRATAERLLMQFATHRGR